jgi:hypothetical protein
MPSINLSDTYQTVGSEFHRMNCSGRSVPRRQAKEHSPHESFSKPFRTSQTLQTHVSVIYTRNQAASRPGRQLRQGKENKQAARSLQVQYSKYKARHVIRPETPAEAETCQNMPCQHLIRCPLYFRPPERRFAPKVDSK